MKIGIAIPSYKRSFVETLDYINGKDVFVYIDKKEEQDYRKNNENINLKLLEDGVQGNIARVRNAILEDMFKVYDVVAITDDDLKHIGRYEDNKYIKLNGDEIFNFIEKYTILTKEFGFKMFGLNVNMDKQVYREGTPFSTKSFIGAPFCVFVEKNNCCYDEKIPLKEDYDMFLMQCHKNRGVLRLNAWSYNVKQNQQVGGCSSMRNQMEEIKQLKRLQKKWGDKIVKIDKSDKSHKSKKKVSFDLNPIIKVPIGGV